MLIKRADLIKRKASRSAISLFTKLFGEEVILTKEIILKHGSNFDVDCFAENFLSSEQLKAYKNAEAPLWQTYYYAMKPIRQAYEDATEPLRKVYEATKLLKIYAENVNEEARLWKINQDAMKPLHKALDDVRKPLFSTYEKQRLEILIEILGV